MRSHSSSESASGFSQSTCRPASRPDRRGRRGTRRARPRRSRRGRGEQAIDAGVALGDAVAIAHRGAHRGRGWRARPGRSARGRPRGSRRARPGQRDPPRPGRRAARALSYPPTLPGTLQGRRTITAPRWRAGEALKSAGWASSRVGLFNRLIARRPLPAAPYACWAFRSRCARSSPTIRAATWPRASPTTRSSRSSRCCSCSSRCSATRSRAIPICSSRVLDSALADFPVIGPQLHDNVHSLRGSAPALGVGIGVAVWAGTSVALALENALDHIWGVPIQRRANPLLARLRALVWIAALGGMTLVGTVLGSASAFATYGPAVRVAAVLVSLRDQHRGIPGGLPSAHEPQPLMARRAPGSARRRGRLGGAAAVGRLHRRPPAAPRLEHLRRLRDRDRAALVDLPGRQGDAVVGRDQRRARAAGCGRAASRCSASSR